MKHHIRSSKKTTNRHNNDSIFLSSYSYSTFQIGLQERSIKEDKIIELPGQPNVDFDQYGGYVTVDPKNGRALYYYFVESSENSYAKPILLWLNGGPGCSSLGYGAMMENGPFIVNRDGKTLTKNLYSWNKVANVLYLESPAGTGFSYSNTSSDYVSIDDSRTVADLYTFFVNWLERFPQYKNRDFFIVGESYSGRIIPQLALLIFHNNKKENLPSINLHGIAIGNPTLDRKIEDEERYNFAWNHALISDDLYQNIKDKCNFTNGDINGPECMMERGNKYDYTVGELNEYNIYAQDNCDPNNTLNMYNSNQCSVGYVPIYLNMAVVQKALHASATSLPVTWEICSNKLSYSPDHQAPMYPFLKELISSKINIWIYSGDADLVMPTIATRRVVKSLKLPIRNEWRPWYYRKEVGGYVEEYEGLTFVTFKGAGHIVPMDQPEKALEMISFFLEMKRPAKNREH